MQGNLFDETQDSAIESVEPSALSVLDIGTPPQREAALAAVRRTASEVTGSFSLTEVRQRLVSLDVTGAVVLCAVDQGVIQGWLQTAGEGLWQAASGGVR